MPVLQILMTCHNRAEVTERCLQSIAAQSGVQCHVLLNDDGSDDKTAEKAAEFDFVHVIQGSGQDYWAGGMRRAWDAMSLDAVDCVVLLNDDVELDEGALSTLWAHCESEPSILWGGAVRDPRTGLVSYGGYSSINGLRKMKMRMVLPEARPVVCDVLNGNILLMSADVARRTRGLSSEFTHAMADFDLSWRAATLGIQAKLAPGTHGTCAPNDVSGTWRDTALPRRLRWRKVIAPTGLPPVEYFVVCRRFGGPLWVLDFLAPYGRILLGR